MKINSKLNLILLSAITLFSLCNVSKVSAQTTSLDVQINDVSGLDAHMEGTQALAVIGTNVYAVFTDTVFGGASDVFLGRSVDGGMTFEDVVTIHTDPNVTDLWASVAVSADGTVHVVWTAITPLPEIGVTEGGLRGGGLQGNFNIWYARSSDNGLTFSAPVALTSNNGSIMPVLGVYGDYVHVMFVGASNYPCADYFMLTSTDGGDTFGVPVQVNDGGCLGTLTFEGLNSMTVAPDGTLHAVWQDARRAAGSGDIFTARSTDHGQSFSTNVMVNTLTSLGVDAVQFYPSIAADDNNHVFVSFTDLRLGSNWEDHRVYLAASSDGGDSFGEEDFLAGLENDLCKYHKLAVSQSGQLVAVLLSTAGMLEWGVYHLVSQDNGATFTTPLNLSDVGGAGPNELSIFLTDNGTTHAVWADEREGQGQPNLYHSKTDFVTSVSHHGSKGRLAVYPNPMSASESVTIEFGELVSKAEVTVFDVNGRALRKQSFANCQRCIMSLDLPVGIYTVSTRTPADHYNNTLILTH